MRGAVLGAILAAGVALSGATCGDALEVASLVANDWLEVTCQNNPKDYCESARTLSLSLSQRLREQRELTVRDVEPLAADVTLLGPRGAAVDDGAELAAGDAVRVAFRPGQRSFVYAFGVDATGVVTPLFPPVGVAGANPVPAAETRVVPAVEGEAWSIGSGVGHVYLVVADGPREALEGIRVGFLTRPRSAGPGQPARVGKPTVIGPPAIRGRDVPTGSASEFAPGAGRYKAPEPGVDLVVTRWLRVRGG